MSIQNNPLGNMYTKLGPVTQKATTGDNQAISNQAKQTTDSGINVALSSLFPDNSSPEAILNTLKSSGLPPMEFTFPGTQGTSITQTSRSGMNYASGYQIINQNGNENYATGTNFDNRITMQGQINQASTGDGNDIITIESSEKDFSDNLVNSGNGNDIINVNGSSNIVYSGDGDDSITVEGRFGYISGDNGNDTFILSKSDTIPQKDDVIQLAGGNGNDTTILYGSSSDWVKSTIQKTLYQDAGHTTTVNLPVYLNQQTGQAVSLTGIENIKFAGNTSAPTPTLPSNVTVTTNAKGGQTDTVKPSAQGHSHISLQGNTSANDVLKLYGQNSAWQIKQLGGGSTVYVNKKTQDVISASGFEQVKFLGKKK
jgi:hypothetical protein